MMSKQLLRKHITSQTSSRSLSKHENYAMQRKALPLLLLTCILLLGLISKPVLAQSSYQLLVNYPEIFEGPNGISLGLYFTILDGYGEIVSDAEILSASILLDDDVYAVDVGKPASDAFIVLTLDSSGSIARAMPQTRQAAIQAVQNAPEEAVFAVLQFNSTITLMQDFSKDRDLLAQQIETIQAVPGSGTCLYDAAFRALELVKSAPRGRRAIILLTDGKDELTPGNPCSQHTYDDVLSLATRQEARVPIHTIGLSTSASSALNEAQLRDMASSTGGFAEFGEQSSVSLLFTKIVNSLSHQWLAQTDVYPSSGKHSASLTITLAGGIQLRAQEVPFTSSGDFPLPPSIAVNSVSYDNQGNVLMDLNLQNPSLIASLEIQIIDLDNNIVAPALNAEVADQLKIDAGNFESGNEYRLMIRGQDEHGILLTETPYDFRFDPTIIQGAISILSVEADYVVPEFLLEIRSQNLDEAASYELWLIDERSNTVVAGTKRIVEPSTLVHIPLETIRNGTYSIALTAIAADSQILAETFYANAVFRLGLLTKISIAIQNSPLSLLFILGILILSVAFLVRKLKPDSKGSVVLLEKTAIESAESLDDWSEDAVRLNKRRLREQIRHARDRARSKLDPVDDLKLTTHALTKSVNNTVLQAGVELPVSRLIVEQAPESLELGKSFDIGRVPYSIGRKGASLEFDFPIISRVHAEIHFQNGEFFIRDDGSTNKTTLDDVLITAEGAIPLKSGAVIGLGKRIRLRFELA